jgi:hypothetical protein
MRNLLIPRLLAGRRRWRGSDLAVPLGDIGVLRSHVLHLFKNLGPLRVAIQEKSMYTVGTNHWLPVFMGSDQNYKAEVEEWLTYNWYPVCNVLGEEFDFQSTLYLASVNIDLWGEFFIYLTETEDSVDGAGDGGYPQIQILWVYQIDQPRAPGALGVNNVLTGNAFGGKYKGLKCEMGVVKNKQGRAVAYSVLMDDPKDDDLIPANDIIRVREMDVGDETRATPTSAHGINQGRSILSLLENEQDFLENASRINLLEWNDFAGMDPSNPEHLLSVMPGNQPGSVMANSESGETTNPPSINGNRTAMLEWMTRAQTRYYNPRTGNKIEAFQFNRPAGEWHQFVDKLARYLLDPIWPFYLLDKEGDLGGAQVRGVLSRANRIIQDRQSLLRRLARRCVQYAVAKASKLGRIPQSEDWWMWNFTLPARITVDFGRDSKAEVMEIDNDILDPAESIEGRGAGSYEQWLLKFYRNKALKIKIKQQVEQETGVQIPDETPPPPPMGKGGDSAEVPGDGNDDGNGSEAPQ